jgi:hypothetical protein
MPRIKSLLKGGLLLACLGLLAFGGKKAGQQFARSGIIARSATKEKVATAGSSPQARMTGATAREGMAASSIKRLEALVDGSSHPGGDWEAQMQIDALIAKLNAAELAEVFASLKEGPYRHILMAKVGAAWMALDPDAALQAALGKAGRGEGYLARMIFGAWAGDDPRTALAWLDSAALPDKPANLEQELRGSAVMGLVERDFELATAEFLKMRESDLDDYAGYSDPMGAWGHLYVDDPAMRERLVAFAKTTGRAGDFASLNRSLLRAWPQDDAMGMMSYMYELRDYLESGAIASEKSPQVDGAAVAAAIHREYDRPALEWWMERYAESRTAVSNWAQRYPDKMLQWFQEQPPSPQRDALASSAIPPLARQGKFEEAARTIEQIDDPAYRQAAAERLEIFWKDKDAAAATAWRASLGEGDE